MIKKYNIKLVSFLFKMLENFKELDIDTAIMYASDVFQDGKFQKKIREWRQSRCHVEIRKSIGI